MSAFTAPVKWAQRKEYVYITIAIADVNKEDAKIEVGEKTLKFSGTSNGKTYELDLEFFAAIDKDDKDSAWNIFPQSIVMKLIKKDQEEDTEFWPRLLADKIKEKTNVTIDWDKYVDEDEAEGNDIDASALQGGMGGMGGMPGMGGMGGMGGMPGMEGMDMEKLMAQMGGGGGMPGMPGGDEGGDDSDDDDDLPDLESTE